MYLNIKFPNNSKENILLQIFLIFFTRRLPMRINENEMTSDSALLRFV
jgi:hypothetical protein